MRLPEQPNYEDMVTGCATSVAGVQQFVGTKSRCTGVIERWGNKSIASGVTSTLNDEFDWRDRYVDCLAQHTPGGNTLPNNARDMYTTPPPSEANVTTPVFPFTASTFRLMGMWYTGTGWDGAAATPNYAAEMMQADVATGASAHSGVLFFVDSASGELKVKNGAANTVEIHWWFRVTPQLGARSTVL